MGLGVWVDFGLLRVGFGLAYGWFRVGAGGFVWVGSGWFGLV